jgi:hypothetical protein
MSYFKATFDMQEFQKRLNNLGLGMTDEVLAAFTGEAAIECFDLSQAEVPVRTGFLKSTGKAEQVPGTTLSRVSYDAPYAVAVHDGWTGRGGKYYKGRKYLYPKNANLAFKNMMAKASSFYRDLASGLVTISSAPKVTLPVSGPSFVGSKGRGFRRATARRITSSGKLSYLYRGPKGRFTKVYFPGVGKGQKQAGRKVRIGSTP